MEITLLEDPACSWCWAFQPAVTALEFELLSSREKRGINFRRVMGGLRDRPALDASFFARHWQTVAELSGMPFNPSIWDRHILKTTFEACRAVKAAMGHGQAAADRYLRRIREAFHVEGVPIDDRETLLGLARSEALDAEAIGENLSNGRAGFLFERDRREAAEYRFGFPTLILRKLIGDPPTVLHGVVAYSEILQTMHDLGWSSADRRRFVDRPEDWARLFAIHRRLTLAEIQRVTRLAGEALTQSLGRNGVRAEGPFFVRDQARPGRGDLPSRATSLAG